MTLVVGRVTPKGDICLIGDTRISDPRRPSGVTNGMLKALLLSTDVVVAFTGDPDLAQQSAIAFRNEYGFSAPFRQTIDHFKRATTDTSNEYLLGFAGPGRLVRVFSGTEREQRMSWLGDKEGFERFQSGPRPSPAKYLRATAIGPDLASPKFVLNQVEKFQVVLEDADVRSIGDFFSLAISRAGKFQTVSISTLYFDEHASLVGPKGERLFPATGENRAYSFSVWPPENMLTAAAAFVFPEVRKAFVFYSSEEVFADRCVVFDGLRGDELAAAILKKTGIAFEVTEIAHQKPS